MCTRPMIGAMWCSQWDSNRIDIHTASALVALFTMLFATVLALVRASRSRALHCDKISRADRALAAPAANRSFGRYNKTRMATIQKLIVGAPYSENCAQAPRISIADGNIVHVTLNQSPGA
jgi:hypothetical protein